MNKLTSAAATFTAPGALVAAPAVAEASSAQADTGGVIATFEGQTFDISVGWGASRARPEIQACHVTETTVDCYRSEADMNDALSEASPAAVLAANCGSTLRLYDGTSHTGAVLSLSQRGSILSLSTYGFDNRTSSYRVGAYSSTFYNGIGSSPYPGNTSANASATSMLSGWNNVISSVYIS
jgi:hypothetical protein